MPLTLANPDRPRRPPVSPPSRSSSSSSHISSSADTHAHTSSNSHSHWHSSSTHAGEHASPPTAIDRLSLRSFVSASEATAVSDHPTVTKALGYSDLPPPQSRARRRGEGVMYGEKLPPPQRSRSGDQVDIHVQYDGTQTPSHLNPHSPNLNLNPPTVTNFNSDTHAGCPPKIEPLQISSSFSPPIHPYAFATTAQLAAALGPDNAPHSTEIASVPCAGVRIPHGPLTGLLAWRLVVRDPRPGPASAGARRSSWWPAGRSNLKTRMGMGEAVGLPPRGVHAYSYSELTPPPNLKELEANGTALESTASLSAVPLPSRAQSVMTIFAAPAAAYYAPVPSDAVAANFILDTSLPYSIIARDTLRALGFALPPDAGDNDGDAEHRYEEVEGEGVQEVEVTVQGVRTRARVARKGEAGRLGVQFLRDAGVSVFFPKDGEGVGPVLYYESARALRDVPRTIAALPPQHRSTSEREHWKPTLPQRVRAFFGLAAAS